MRGSGDTRVKLFLDSVRLKNESGIRNMERAYSSDPTPFLRQKIDAARSVKENLLKKLKQMHGKFEDLMSLSDSELSSANSQDRSEPLLGEPRLVKKIAERKMTEKEYVELTEGPDVIARKG